MSWVPWEGLGQEPRRRSAAPMHGAAVPLGGLAPSWF